MIEITRDADVCRKCGLCVMACGRAVFRQEAKGTMPEIAALERCFGCGHCVSVCPQGAISHSAYPEGMVTPIKSEQVPNYDQVLELIHSHRSKRRFRDRTVERDAIEKVLEAARFAPSEHNTQTTEFVVILAWSSEHLLPGHPLLEARLKATTAGIAPFVEGMEPESHFLRALGWFRDAGLEERTARTFAGEAHAPLTDAARSALTALFEMRWPGVEPELRKVDADGERLWAEYRRLCLPESPDFILDHPDYYAFFTYSMFQGKVAV